jgi:hypothetical protein
MKTKGDELALKKILYIQYYSGAKGRAVADRALPEERARRVTARSSAPWMVLMAGGGGQVRILDYLDLDEV